VPQQPEENIGVLDAYLRLLGGFALLALGMGRKLGRASSFLAILLGASKVAEGITRYCPLYDLLDLTSADGTVRRIERPRVALLNIGVEATKGHDTIKDASALLKASSLNYVGFIEGNEIFSGKADVVVTDGFTGNVALKTMEGTVGLAAHYLRRAFTRNAFARLQALLARPVLRRLAIEMDSRNYNGASLVGLNGIVIKSHGSADAYAFQHAIETALVEVKNQVPVQIGNLLQQEAA